MNLRDRMDYIPQHPPGGASDPLDFGATVADWLEVETPGTPPAGPCTIVAITADGGGGEALFAVPDSEIDGELREALDQAWARVFAVEEIATPGPMWLLAYTGFGDSHDYNAFGEGLGLDPARLRAAHGAWRRYGIASFDVLGAQVTHLYVARLAH